MTDLTKQYLIPIVFGILLAYVYIQVEIVDKNNHINQNNSNNTGNNDFQNIKFINCYDGDTCKFDIPNIPAIFGNALSVRIYGIDTPGKVKELYIFLHFI